MVLEVPGSWMGVGLVGVAISPVRLCCDLLVSFFGGHNSGTASMETAVSAGAATAGVRGGVGLCSFVVTMATAVSVGAATAGVRDIDGIGFCSCSASVITLVTVAAAKSESWSMTTDLPS